MKYIKSILRKELKSSFYNKKLLIFSIISILVIFILMIRSRDLFEPTGIHSFGFIINLILCIIPCQLLPQSYFYDKESGIEILLILKNKIFLVSILRILLYSLINIMILTIKIGRAHV